ncbi:ead/Ea22-like family protein [Enterobacter hormaechei]|nr:ead/Ea22-like family protein [Enterobacter hormaechei]
MSNIDKRALREAANAANAASWGYWDSYKPHKGARGYEVKVGVKAVAQHCLKVDSVFIAAANPATVLALLDELEAADKRIAELERNEIREEGNQFLVVRHPGKLPVVKHCAGELEGFLRQLLEHDPMATIDIVTHRYYGVGGQWVQEADEYLQMMAAAAGKGESS